ncbi:uncharacterized protein NDAI_0D01290 [Naumovozyma dairenensis CBS 421]|uniref:Protein DOM34 homolog n=1 Tax=Naumovozyma dairenensis (strain ATCC 10597 / BCRC 20456 / CBS 421 / NBRC 0211 / NRRL Y-12639) TaxID=1071378 RepID=G0W9I2_NAUDC|nr:hypothetical protein NDAI_0D01290 [Naumovozyma dairenensis CBS 421]CCD24443.1 hypothetical protein NDAI_0D01290 [Naumovozyma dairenensis CBS 421]
MRVLKLLKNATGGASISLLPEDKEDLFTIHQLIDKDDEIIFKKKFTTKTAQVNEQSSTTKKTTDLARLRIKVLSNEFSLADDYLKYKGVTTTDESGQSNVDIPVGKFLSFVVNFTYPFTIIKDEFDKYAEKLLNNACNPESKSDTAAVVLQEGIAHVCLLTPSSTILKQKIEYSMPKKKRSTDVMKFDEKTTKFYKAIYESIKKNFDISNLKLILLCSPAFYAKTLYDKILQYAKEEQNKLILSNQNKFLVAHCSTGYLQGISEVLKDPLFTSKLNDTKYTQDVQILDDFLKHLDADDFKAWYGESEVVKAAEMGAINYLLITDIIMRSSDLVQRKKFQNVADVVEQNGGKVIVFSTLHESGEELDKLTGVACILKYPLPDLDEDYEDGEDI